MVFRGVRLAFMSDLLTGYVRPRHTRVWVEFSLSLPVLNILVTDIVMGYLLAG